MGLFCGKIELAAPSKGPGRTEAHSQRSNFNGMSPGACYRLQHQEGQGLVGVFGQGLLQQEEPGGADVCAAIV